MVPLNPTKPAVEVLPAAVVGNAPEPEPAVALFPVKTEPLDSLLFNSPIIDLSMSISISLNSCYGCSLILLYSNSAEQQIPENPAMPEGHLQLKMQYEMLQRELDKKNAALEQFLQSRRLSGILLFFIN